jgi:hypothetical protein
MIKIITKSEYEQFQVLKKVWKHIQFKRSGAYFIFGEYGERDSLNLPEWIMVLPSYGSSHDQFQIYKKMSK